MSREPVSPNFHSRAFQCPHSDCRAEAQQSWAKLYSVDAEQGDSNDSGFEISICHVCQQSALWQRGWTNGFSDEGSLVYPLINHSGPQPNPDMPDPVKALYNEARSVVTLSPRSASALLRLSLEALLEGLYPNIDKLNDRIGEAARNGVPDLVIKAMDVLRSKGNDSVHKVEVQDTAETANSLFRIVNLVVERLITEPREIAEMHAALPEGVRAQIDRRDSTAG